MNRLWLSVLSFCLITVFAASVQAKTLKIGMGLSKPPYIIQDENAGVEVDIITRAFELVGHKVIPQYMPLRRILHALNGKAIDGGINIRPNIKVDAHLSDVMIYYRNYAISLRDKDVQIDEISDLANYRVVAFQNAHRLLGDEFAKSVEFNSGYSEIGQQELQVKMLMAGRVDAVVADFRIFLHFKEKLATSFPSSSSIDFHAIFPPTPYRAAFIDPEVRDDFNKGLARLKASGEYDEILSKYIKLDELPKDAASF
jgi:polar amino acid transport system substrate-binding protein